MTLLIIVTKRAFCVTTETCTIMSLIYTSVSHSYRAHHPNGPKKKHTRHGNRSIKLFRQTFIVHHPTYRVTRSLLRSCRRLCPTHHNRIVTSPLASSRHPYFSLVTQVMSYHLTKTANISGSHVISPNPGVIHLDLLITSTSIVIDNRRAVALSVVLSVAPTSPADTRAFIITASVYHSVGLSIRYYLTRIVVAKVLCAQHHYTVFAKSLPARITTHIQQDDDAAFIMHIISLTKSVCVCMYVCVCVWATLKSVILDFF
jgi:hypothetical protein